MLIAVLTFLSQGVLEMLIDSSVDFPIPAFTCIVDGSVDFPVPGFTCIVNGSVDGSVDFPVPGYFCNVNSPYHYQGVKAMYLYCYSSTLSQHIRL